MKGYNTRLIELFGVSVANSSKAVDAQRVNSVAYANGYLIHPDICNEDTLKFANDQKTNYNATFYQEWIDILSKSRFELFIDQILHYATTYGTDFSLGNGYVPNSGAENVPVLDFEKHKVILPCTVAEMFNKCTGMLYSGIAINSADVAVLTDYIVANFKEKDCVLDVDKVKNREAMILLCDKLGLCPSDKFALIKYIVYKTTGDTMIIKNRAMIQKIKNSSTPFDFTRLNDNQMKALASIFYRYKDIILAFKHNCCNPAGYLQAEMKRKGLATGYINNAAVINKLRRMAVQYHKPMAVGFWENVLTDIHDLDEVRNAVVDASNFKLINLMQTIREKTLLAATRGGKELYIIRNGKTFIKDVSMDLTGGIYEYWEKIYEIFENQLVENLKSKATIVKFSDGYELVCPTSEKNFMGNFPMGSYYRMEGSNFFGIYWKNAWGTRDFDLSFMGTNGERVGWNSWYRSNDDAVIFSGDMTNAQPEATEVLYCEKDMPEGVINVNRYSGDEGSKFKLFFGSDKIDRSRFTCGYMVNPNSVKMTEMLTSTTREQMVGIVADKRAYLLNLNTGNGRVSRTNPSDMFEIFRRKAASYINLKDILLKAGFVEYDENDEEMNALENHGIGLDLTDLKKDTLISLFSNE